MVEKVNGYVLDRAEPSGRDDWWVVINGVALWRHSYHKAQSLDEYIVLRAERGCADCISAIMECSNDKELQLAVNRYRSGGARA